MNNTLQSTTRLYLSNPEVSTCTAIITDVQKVDQPDMLMIVTNQTPFYPKGGGQPSDIGSILFENETIPVHQAIIDNDGNIGHLISKDFSQKVWAGQEVSLMINQSVRYRHSVIHTAGELICATNRVLGHDWPVISAIHYPDNASIDFDVQLGDKERESYKDVLQSKIRELIKVGSRVVVDTLTDASQVIERCGYYPDYIKRGEKIRVVTVLAGIFGRPCAGTHLENINELNDVVITKVKSQKGRTQVRYLSIF